MTGTNPANNSPQLPVRAPNATPDQGLHDTASDVVREIPDLSSVSATLKTVQSFIRSPLDVLQWIAAETGDLAKFALPFGSTYIVTSDSEIISQVLGYTDKGSSTNDRFDKSPLLVEGSGWVIGDDNILVASNKKWNNERKFLGKFFGRSRYEDAALISQFDDAVLESRDTLAKKIALDSQGSTLIELQKELSVLALRTTMKTIFDIHDTPLNELEEVVHHSRVIHTVFPLETLIPGDIPFDSLKWFSSRAADVVESREYLKTFAEKIMSKVEANPDNTSFVRPLLMRNIDRSEAMEHILTIAFAGHETSGNNLSWTMTAILQNAVIRERVQQEINQIDLSTPLALSELIERLPYTGCAIEEGLRMYPSVYLLIRRATEEVEIPTRTGTITIPDKSEVFLNIFNAQRDESVWGIEKTGYPADKFCPERWSKENIAARGLTSSDLDLFTFGGGSRTCIGMHSFKALALLTISHYMKRFDMTCDFSLSQSDVVSDFTLQRNGGFPTVVKSLES